MVERLKMRSTMGGDARCPSEMPSFPSSPPTYMHVDVENMYMYTLYTMKTRTYKSQSSD